MTALLVSLLALPVAILFTVGVPFAFLATRRAQLGSVRLKFELANVA